MAGSTASSSEGLASAFLPGARTLARVYLDYGGFSPVDPRVLGVMRPFLESGIGNPSAPHSYGDEARTALDAARAKVARLFGGAPGGLIFTSGATEANNLAVRGLTHRPTARRQVVVSAIEHSSIINACRDLEKRGYTVAWIPVDPGGRVAAESVLRAVGPETALVSIHAANGEIGTIQPLREFGHALRSRGVPLHVDGVGAVGRIPLAVDECGVDLLTVSSNDLAGPPGVGALWVRPDSVRLAPLIVGGGEERGLRAGTPNLPAIVGMGVAADLARLEWPREMDRLAPLRDRLVAGFTALPGVRLTGARGCDRLPHHVSIVVGDVKADSVLLDLDGSGIAASSGSACAASTGEGSHVLRALGCGPREHAGGLCFTLGRWTTTADADAVLEVLPPIIDRLRRLAPPS